MQQHENEILIGYRTTMGLNEVPCINNHLNSVHFLLQKRQILYEFLFYPLGLQGDVVYSRFLLVCRGKQLTVSNDNRKKNVIKLVNH